MWDSEAGDHSGSPHCADGVEAEFLFTEAVNQVAEAVHIQRLALVFYCLWEGEKNCTLAMSSCPRGHSSGNLRHHSQHWSSECWQVGAEMPLLVTRAL